MYTAHPGINQLVVNTSLISVVQTFIYWISGWKINDWRRYDGEPVMNQDLIKEIDELITTMEIKWVNKIFKSHLN